MTLVHSRFNHIAGDPGSNTWVLYNFATGRSIRLDALSLGLYHAASSQPDTPFARSLERQGFLVRGDELAALRHATNLHCYSNKLLMLTVCPTMGCNFACPYCFEEHRSGRMNQETQDAVAAFIEDQLQRYGMRRLCLVWFGGEPLLQPKTIHSLSQRILEICERLEVGYQSNIVTNGYLLDAQNATLLAESHVTGMQITLDGPDAKTHDLTRFVCGGGGSFERIIGNLRALPAGFEVKIRCNVGPHNIEMLQPMRELVRELGEASPSHFEFVPGIMDTDVAKTPDALEGAMQSAGYEAVNQAFNDFGIIDYDSIGVKMPGCFHGTFCGSQCAHTYVIDEDGDLYRCWEDCGNKDVAFGNVASFNSQMFGMNPKATAYLDGAWCGDDPQCGKCPILPICMGSCPQRHKASGKRRCPWFKDDLDAYVLRLVNN